MYALIAISFVGGIALLVNGVGVTRREGFSLAHALPLFFGLMGLAWPIMYFMFLILPDWIMPLYNAVWGIFLYVPGMLAAVLLLSFVYAALPKPKHADFIVVLGAGLKDDGTVSPLLAKRVDRAIKLYMDEGKTASFVVSGGKGTDEVNSEAFAMRLYLLEHGIDDSQIIMEDQSVNTQENIRFSKKLILERKQDYRAAVVTSNYHVLRAVILAKNERMNAYGIGGKTALYYLPAAFIREYIAVIFNYKKLAIFYVTAVLIIAILEILF
jgi:uncharacterized SAM-binding protein YcdF (DUF218 family)